MKHGKNNLPKRRIATTGEIREWASGNLVRRRNSEVPFYIPHALFGKQTKLRSSLKRFYRVLKANGFISPRQDDGIFIQGLALLEE